MSEKVIPLFQPKQPKSNPPTMNNADIVRTYICIEQSELLQRAIRDSSAKLLKENGEEEFDQIAADKLQTLHNTILQSMSLWVPKIFDISGRMDASVELEDIGIVLNHRLLKKQSRSILPNYYAWLEYYSKTLQLWDEFSQGVVLAADRMCKKRPKMSKYEALHDTQCYIYAALTTFPDENSLDIFIHTSVVALSELNRLVLIDLIGVLDSFCKNKINKLMGTKDIMILPEVFSLLDEAVQIYGYYLANYLSKLVEGHSTRDLRSIYIRSFDSGGLWKS